RSQPPMCTLFPYTTLFRSEPGLPPARERRKKSNASRRSLVEPHDRHIAARGSTALRRGPECGLLFPRGIERRRIVFGANLVVREDRKSTRLNSSHVKISYA